MPTCTHAHGTTLCFECFKAGMERTRARQRAYAQRSLPFEQASSTDEPLSAEAVAHRRQMLAYLERTARRGA